MEAGRADIARSGENRRLRNTGKEILQTGSRGKGTYQDNSADKDEVGEEISGRSEPGGRGLKSASIGEYCTKSESVSKRGG